MTPQRQCAGFKQRMDFILNYINNSMGGCDVLAADFVNDYIVATGAGVHLMPYGAHKCPQLGRDLARMFKEGYLSRTRVGIQGFAGMGFPHWVYNYTVSPCHKLLLDEIGTSERRS